MGKSLTASASSERRNHRLHPAFIAFLLACLPLTGQVEITLRNSFIEKYKNVATIDANYTVDKAHPKPNTPKKDGDIHIAGRATEVQLPTVAEIMNAASEKEAVDLIHQVEGTGNPVKLSGVWRIWCEHAGNYEQIQGDPLEPFATTNPPHVFEIHPVTQLGGKSILGSFKPIEGFEPKDAATAFDRYENMQCNIIPKTGKTTIVTKGLGYNYVEFTLRLLKTPKEISDGYLVFVQVLDRDGEVLVQNLRTVFVKETEPAVALGKHSQ